MQLDKLIQYFDSINLSEHNNTRLNQCTVIANAELFIKHHVSFLKGNPKNKRFIPYYNRLLKFYQIIDNKLKK